ncbi:Ribose ABC transporter, periplasmic ribose-binding protein RbsB (TC 3.A.1.2.1) [Gulosibacter sp. 10]|nr:Ribose ABC transporter, periplasmic ribose-binding protein RbsB (TC 3.A.1.2.1) [Gulosibacter sp. 10]
MAAAVAASLALALSGCGPAITTGAEGVDAGTCAPEDIFLVDSGRGLQNEYYVAVEAGAKAFAEEMGMLDQYQWISSDGDSSKQLSQIKAILAKHGHCTVLNIDANESSIVPALVHEVESYGAWLVTQWNKPDGSSPLTSSPHWVAHMSVNGVPQGYETAKALFEEMGGEGSVVVLQGILDNPPAKERFEGFQMALEEYPGIEMIENQTAGWDRTEAQNITETWITAHGDEIGGVWSAGDDMALGAREALLNAGIEAPVTGVDGLSQAQQLVAEGSGSLYVATTQSTGVLQGAYGLAIAYAAATGEVDPASLPPEQREFYLEDLPVVTRENVNTIRDAMDTTFLEFEDPWQYAGDPITD